MKRFLVIITLLYTILLIYSPVTNASEFNTVVLNIYEDTYTDFQEANKTSSTEKYLKVGENGRYTTYFKYSTIALENLGVQPSDIISAKIHLYHEYLDGFDQVYVELYETRTDWKDAQLSYANKPNILNTKLHKAYIPKTKGWVSMDITETMMKHLEENTLNKGFALKQGNTGDGISHFWSRNCRIVSELPKCTGDQIPYVSVTYWPNNPPSASVLTSPQDNSIQNEYTQMFDWEKAQDPDDEKIVYRLEIATDQLFSEILLSTDWLEETSYEYTFHTENIYYWRIISKDEHTEQYGSSMSETWSLTIQEEIIEEPIIEVPVIIEEEIISEEIIILDSPQPKQITPTKIITTIHIPEEPILGKVLGTSTTVQPKSIKTERVEEKGSCKYRYNITTDKVIKQSCTLPSPIPNNISYTKNSFGVYEIQIQGNIVQEIDTVVDIVRCKERSFWDPRTWRGCVEIGNETMTGSITSRNIVQIVDEANNLLDLNYHRINNQGEFDISYTTTKEDSFYIRTVTYISIKLPDHSIWIDDSLTTSPIKLELPKISTIENNKPFRFPFSKSIGVTQWHGYTDYQSPHTGIDFGASNEKIYALSDGYIRTAMWDNYYGTCLSGGNVLRIEYDNGIHSVLMHLKNYKKPDGTNWEKGERVKKGDLLAISGNSGAYNCQALSYHLHLEVREDKAQSTHVDPVKYISTNWNAIPTIQYTSYPGRLSGDNPHPGK